jgi:ribosome-binding factor A
MGANLPSASNVCRGAWAMSHDTAPLPLGGFIMSKKRTSPNRNIQIADQIQRDLSELIAREVKDPRIGLVTIQSVELTPDYAHAKVYFTTLTGDPQATQVALNHAAGHLHNLLFKRLHIHTVPTLHFHYDKSIEKAVEMSRLIDEANATRAKDD